MSGYDFVPFECREKNVKVKGILNPMVQEPSTYSLVFCKQRAADPSVSNFSDIDFSEAFEIGWADSFFKNVLGDSFICGQAYLVVTGTNENSERHKYDVELRHLPQYQDFEYFTSEQFLSDGTSTFLYDAFERIASKVSCAMTYDKNIGKPNDGDRIRYTFGNFVVLTEYSDDFAPNSERWLKIRTTVLLPLRMEKL